MTTSVHTPRHRRPKHMRTVPPDSMSQAQCSGDRRSECPRCSPLRYYLYQARHKKIGW